MSLSDALASFLCPITSDVMDDPVFLIETGASILDKRVLIFIKVTRSKGRQLRVGSLTMTLVL